LQHNITLTLWAVFNSLAWDMDMYFSLYGT